MRRTWWPRARRAGAETEWKAIVAIAVERRGRALGRVRLARVADVSGESLVD